MGPDYDIPYTRLGVLYGVPPSDEDQRTGPISGLPGLREVFMVQHSNLWPVKQGEIDSSICFRSAIRECTTIDERRSKGRLQAGISFFTNPEFTTLNPEVGDNWRENKKPIFKMVSLARKQVGVDKGVFDPMLISNGAAMLSLSNIKTRMELIEQGAERGDEVSFCRFNFRTDLEREIGLLGSEQGIREVKTILQNWISFNIT
jgi:hypothetical protein